MSIEDPGCLASAGILSSNYETPVIQRPAMTPSFDFARRQVCAPPEDPGCLEHLNVAFDASVIPPPTRSTPFVAGKTVDLSVEAWGQRELQLAEDMLNAEAQQQTASVRVLALT